MYFLPGTDSVTLAADGGGIKIAFLCVCMSDFYGIGENKNYLNFPDSIVCHQRLSSLDCVIYYRPEVVKIVCTFLLL